MGSQAITAAEWEGWLTEAAIGDSIVYAWGWPEPRTALGSICAREAEQACLVQITRAKVNGVMEWRAERIRHSKEAMMRAAMAAKRAGLRRAEAERRRIANRPARLDRSLCYFIAADGGPIKIGRSRDVMARLRSLQTGHHGVLALLACVPNGIEAEARYHRQFAAFRLTGEWFARDTSILLEIDRINSCAADMASPTP